jgi:ABC-type uncharacterized transport system involved in gliding motility auxiliary subunit
MKTLKPFSPFLKYLFIPGLILAVAGGVAGSLSQTWTTLYIGLMVAGIGLLVVWLLVSGFFVQGFWSRRSTRAGANALVSTVSLLAILVMINFLAIKSPIRIDLTENQLFTLTPETKTLVKALPKPLKVWIFSKEISAMDRQLLSDYQGINPNLTYEVVDPLQKPNLARQFQVKTPGEVYLEYDQKKQLLKSGAAENQGQLLSEIKLSNGIAKIQRDREPLIYFLQGHDEAGFKEGAGGLTQAIAQLQSKGFNTIPLNLLEKSAIPDDADAIVVAGAKRSLFPQEVAALKAYSDRGGSLLLLIDPSGQTDPKALSNLEPLLKAWGVSLDPRVVIDASGSGKIIGLGPEIPMINRYGKHPITESFGNGSSFFPIAHPVATRKIPDVNAYSLVESNDKMWAESDLNSSEVTYDPQKDLAGPFDLGVALTRKVADVIPSPTAIPSPSPQPSSAVSAPISPPVSPSPQASASPAPPISSNLQPKEARMVVFGSAGFITNGWFDKQLNGDILLNSVEWLTNKTDQPLGIRPKEQKNRQIVLSKLQANLLAWGGFFLVPLFGLVLAGVTWWRRR